MSSHIFAVPSSAGSEKKIQLVLRESGRSAEGGWRSDQQDAYGTSFYSELKILHAGDENDVAESRLRTRKRFR